MALDMLLPFFLSHFLLIFIASNMAEGNQIFQSAEFILKRRLSTINWGVYPL